MSVILPRRSLIKGLVSLMAAPAIVKAESLMRLPRPPVDRLLPLVSTSYDEFVERMLREIANSMGLPYDLIVYGMPPRPGGFVLDFDGADGEISG